jgi:hypothetical protein
MIHKGMAVVTAAVEWGRGRMGAWLGVDLIIAEDNAAGVQGARVWRWQAVAGGLGETGAVEPRG